MVKKKSVKKPKKNQQKQSFWVSIKSLSLLKKLIILAVALYVGFIAYNVGVDRYNVSLLNKAEAKMSQLDFPGGEKGEIERYCSERSVKFGSPGKPTCGVSIKTAYDDSRTISNSNTKETLRSLEDLGFLVSVREEDSGRVYYNLSGLDDSLVCYMGDVLSKNYADNEEEQHIAIYCQKEFQSKVYPIRN